MNRLHRQRGVALITAMLIVALAVILATQIGFDSALEQQRTTTALLQDQAYQVGLGAEAWAASFLHDDFEHDHPSSSGAGATAPQAQDHLAEAWATPIPPIPIDGGQIEGQLEDLQGKFNVNNLAVGNEDNRKRWKEVFTRLLVSLELEPKWADSLTDWIDANNETTPFEGAEDEVYTAMTPPYRAANTTISSISELLALPGFGIERYNRLKPYIAALPITGPERSTGTKVNVCTAPAAVLDALSNEQQFTRDPKGTAQAREKGCFPDLSTLPDEVRQNLAVQQTHYFRLSAFITIGEAEFSLYSLLYRRDGTGQVRTLMRTMSAE